MEDERVSGGGLRDIALIGAGVLAATALTLCERSCAGPPPAARPPRLWLADRDAGAVFGLDEELFVTRRVAAPHPVALAAADDGGWWALCAVDGWRGGAYALERRSAAGELFLRLAAPGPARLLADGAGGVIVLPEEPGAAWTRLGRDGAPRALPPREGAAVLAAGAGGLALGGPGGRLRCFEGPRERARIELAGAVLALAPAGGTESGWWALLARGRLELARLDADLAERWAVPFHGADSPWAPCADGARVWRIDRLAGALLRIGRGGLELRRADEALRDALAALALPGGGLLVLTPGALLRYDARGRRRPGQGGFDRLSGVVLRAQPPG